MKKLAFLTSPRFYANICIALGALLISGDFTLVGFGNFLQILGGLFVGVRTVDRAVEYLGSKQK